MNLITVSSSELLQCWMMYFRNQVFVCFVFHRFIFISPLQQIIRSPTPTASAIFFRGGQGRTCCLFEKKLTGVLIRGGVLLRIYYCFGNKKVFFLVKKICISKNNSISLPTENS